MVFVFIDFDLELLQRLKNIITVISCSKEVRIEEYRIDCHEMARLWATKYSWYPMPISLHIVLLHSCKVMETFRIPFALLAEEALEATHKFLKHMRAFNARKNSR